MNEDSLYELLENYKQAIDFLSQRVEEMDKMIHDYAEQNDDRFHKLEEVIQKDLLEPAIREEDERQFHDFHEKFADKLDPYTDMLRSIEGDDFDFARQAYKDYSEYEPDEGEEMPSEEAYLEKYLENADAQIARIKEAMGVPSDAETEIVNDEEGTKLMVDGEEVAEVPSEEGEDKAEEEADKGEEETEGEEEAEEGEDEEDDELSEEELAEIEREIAQLKR